MKSRLFCVFCLVCFINLMISLSIQAQVDYDLTKVMEHDLGMEIGQLRAVSIQLGPNKPGAFLLIYSEDEEIDPYIGMFFFPKGTTKFRLLTETGKVRWQKDLGTGMVSGVWFLTVFPFDLDSDDVDEIWFVNNTDPEHPMDYHKYVIERLDSKTGKTLGRWPWPLVKSEQTMSHTYRNFIFGGYVNEVPVLVTGQGTYGPMSLQGWNPDMTKRWEYTIKSDTPGARGSHVCPVLDLDNAGSDEFMWGERCISIKSGQELFCCDGDTWNEHSDIIAPILDWQKNEWYIHTCREKNRNLSPRIALFDNDGTRIWGALDKGHIDTGWAARIGEHGEPIVLGVRVGQKVRSAEGESRLGVEPFTFEAFTGKSYNLPYNAYTTIPVDLNGDGIHELVKGYFEGDGTVVDRFGNDLGNVDGLVVMACKFFDLPGEQILSYDKAHGIVKVWADRNAHDTLTARKRYKHSFYNINKRLTGCGYNLFLLGGI